MSKFKNNQIMNKILSNYPIKVVNIKKVRSAYKIYSEEKCFCFKKSKHTTENIEKVNSIIEYLYKNGFNNVPKIIKTNDLQLCMKYKKDYYYMTEWISGDEIDLTNKENIIKAIKLLAEFNKALIGYTPESINVEYKYTNIKKEFYTKIEQIKECRKYISKRKIKGKFDYTYTDNIDYFVKRGELAIQILEDSNFDEKVKDRNNLTLSHDSFYYQNIIALQSGKYYIVDLDKCAQNILTYDLGKFIRRTMCKDDYLWDFSKANELINCYKEVNPLDADDMKILLAIIIFPHKFWKVGRKRYKKNKEWLEEKYMKKLKDIISQNPLIDKFTEEYKEFYNI